MEKEFVSYEIALALKELGFDEPCFGGWDKDRVWWYHPDSDIVVDAPLKQQVFKFFRDKYKIDSYLEPIGTNKRFYSIYILFENNEEIKGDGNLYKTYEEAESTCIDKLIEIVKNK